VRRTMEGISIQWPAIQKGGCELSRSPTGGTGKERGEERTSFDPRSTIRQEPLTAADRLKEAFNLVESDEVLNEVGFGSASEKVGEATNIKQQEKGV
jgi:hypothetical protein